MVTIERNRKGKKERTIKKQCGRKLRGGERERRESACLLWLRALLVATGQ